MSIHAFPQQGKQTADTPVATPVDVKAALWSANTNRKETGDDEGETGKSGGGAATGTGTGTTDTGKSDGKSGETGKGDTGKTDTGKTDTGKTDTGKTETGSTDTGKTEGGKSGKGDSGGLKKTQDPKVIKDMWAELAPVLMAEPAKFSTMLAALKRMPDDMVRFDKQGNATANDTTLHGNAATMGAYLTLYAAVLGGKKDEFVATLDRMPAKQVAEILPLGVNVAEAGAQAKLLPWTAAVEKLMPHDTARPTLVETLVQRGAPVLATAQVPTLLDKPMLAQNLLAALPDTKARVDTILRAAQTAGKNDAATLTAVAETMMDMFVPVKDGPVTDGPAKDSKVALQSLSAISPAGAVQDGAPVRLALDDKSFAKLFETLTLSDNWVKTGKDTALRVSDIAVIADKGADKTQVFLRDMPAENPIVLTRDEGNALRQSLRGKSTFVALDEKTTINTARVYGVQSEIKAAPLAEIKAAPLGKAARAHVAAAQPATVRLDTGSNWIALPATPQLQRGVEKLAWAEIKNGHRYNPATVTAAQVVVKDSRAFARAETTIVTPAGVRTVRTSWEQGAKFVEKLAARSDMLAIDRKTGIAAVAKASAITSVQTDLQTGKIVQLGVAGLETRPQPLMEKTVAGKIEAQARSWAKLTADTAIALDKINAVEIDRKTAAVTLYGDVASQTVTFGKSTDRSFTSFTKAVENQSRFVPAGDDRTFIAATSVTKVSGDTVTAARVTFTLPAADKLVSKIETRAKTLRAMPLGDKVLGAFGKAIFNGASRSSGQVVIRRAPVAANKAANTATVVPLRAPVYARPKLG